MKTLEGWEKSNVNLDKYLGRGPVEVDEGIYLHIAEWSVPYFDDGTHMQNGEATTTVNGITYRDTFFTESVEGSDDVKYFYLGILPEFKDGEESY